jgi:replication factor A1
MRAALYDRVKDLLAKDAFDARVRAKVEEWGALLDEDSAARLVLDEFGRGTANFQTVKELREGMEVALRVRVEGFSPIREFHRQDGSPGRVVNADISDETGRSRLVLWDEDVALVEQGRLRVGMTVRLVDCFVRTSRFGIEVSRGKFGAILPEA